MPSKNDATFIDLCLRGEASLDEIDDFIDKWHDSSHTNTLHEYLGLSWEEYVAWVADPNVLYAIFKKRVKPDNKKGHL